MPIKIPSLKNKNIVKTLLFIALVGLIFLLVLIRTSQKKPTILPPISPTPSVLQPPSVKTQPSYYLNQITNTKIPVTGYSWNENQLLYSTPTGIYQAGTNTTIKETPISYISWAHNGNAIYKSGNSWFLFVARRSSSEPIDISAKDPLINPTGDRILSIENSIIKTVSLPSGIETKLDLKNKINNAEWSINTNWIAIQQTLSDQTVIQLLDEGLNVKQSLTFTKNTQLQALSPDAKTLILSQPGKLIIHPLSGEQSTLAMDEKAEITVSWINKNQIIAIETSIDSLGRNLDYIWRLNPQSASKEILSTSMPIPRKLNNNVSLSTNSIQAVLPLVENRNTLWLLALLPDLFPSYTTEGHTFFPMKSYSHD